MFLDNGYEKNVSFSSLEDMLVILIGFDKSDTDFVGTWRPCNRKFGKLGWYVQAVLCLEGPVAETYKNEIITIDNPAYPTRETVQHLVNDFLFALIFTTNKGSKRICACSIFYLFQLLLN